MISKKNRLKKFKDIIFFSRKYLTIAVVSLCVFFFWRNVDFVEYFNYISLKNLFYLSIFFLFFLLFESILFKKIIDPFVKINLFLSYNLTLVSYFLNLILPFSGIGFRYIFLKNNFNFSIKNMFFITAIFYIVNFIILLFLLTFIFLFSENSIVRFYEKMILYLIIVLFFIIIFFMFYLIKKIYNIFEVYQSKQIFLLLTISFIMYLVFILFIFFTIITFQPNFNNLVVSSLIAILVDLSLVVQILPVGIVSIELIFYKILTNVNFNQSEIISIVSLFRAVVHITTFILGSLLFYKYFNLSLKKIKNND